MASHRTAPTRRRPTPFYLRTTHGERGLLDAAAALSGDRTGPWVLRTALREARVVLRRFEREGKTL